MHVRDVFPNPMGGRASRKRTVHGRIRTLSSVLRISHEPSHWLTNERDLGAARSSGRERCRAKSCTGRCVTAQTLGFLHGRAIALYTSPADTARPVTESTAAAESLVEGNAVHDDGHSAATCHMFKSTTMMAGVCE